MLRLHHTGLLVRDLPTAAAGLVERFFYVVESDVIEDHVQTALVQFLRQPGTSSWLELVTPNDRASKLSRAAASGGGLHHLCYETDDIEGSVAEMRGKAMMTLCEPVPAMAFGGRRIAWLMDRSRLLVELVEAGPGPLSLATITESRGGLR